MTDGEYEGEKPDSKTKSCSVDYDNSEPRRVVVTTEHFVDAWYSTTFEFEMVGSTARLRKIDSPMSSGYYVQQNEPAREQAVETVENLPFVQAVTML